MNNYFLFRTSYFYKYYDMVDEYGLFQMNRCVFYCFGAILQQGGTKLPDADSGKIFIAGWWLFVICIVTYYSGALVAMIAIPQIEPSLDNFPMMLEKDLQYDWGYQENSEIERYFKETPEQFFQDFDAKAEAMTPASVDVDSPMWERIKKEDFVYIDQLATLEQLSYQQYLKTGQCNYAYSREHLFFQHLAFAFPKDSPWVQPFSDEIKKMKWSGLTKSWKKV